MNSQADSKSENNKDSMKSFIDTNFGKYSSKTNIFLIDELSKMIDGKTICPIINACSTYCSSNITLLSDYNQYISNVIINNQSYKYYTKQEKELFMACLCFLYSIQKKFQLSNQQKQRDFNFLYSICDFYKTSPDNNEILKFIKEFLSKKYLFNGINFYEYLNGVWTICSEDKIYNYIDTNKILEPHYEDFIWKTGCDIHVETFGSNDPSVIQGVENINIFLNKMEELVVEFDDFESIVDLVKENIVSIHPINNIIPCKTKYIDLANKEIKSYEKSDNITMRLKYDPSTEKSKIVNTFLGAFKCNFSYLATTLMRFGTNDKSITLIIGPTLSGKETLALLACQLFKPYVECAHYDLILNDPKVHTGIYRNDNFPFYNKESELKSHPYNQIVITCQKDPIPTRTHFADREIHRLYLTGQIDSNKRKQYPLSKINNHHQLKCLLGFCLSYYNKYEFQSNINNDNEDKNDEEQSDSEGYDETQSDDEISDDQKEDDVSDDKKDIYDEQKIKDLEQKKIPEQKIQTQNKVISRKRRCLCFFR